MSDRYRVNTDELEAVVRRLRALQQNLSQTGTRSKYDTVVARNDFGGAFHEADALGSAHDNMQQFLASMVSDLDKLIGDFGNKSQTATDAYKAREDEGESVMTSYQARLG